MTRWPLTVLVLGILLAPAAVGDPAVARTTDDSGGTTPGTSRNFVRIGHSALGNRGMNAALAVNGRYVYVGNRTDGSSRCGIGDPRRDTTGIDSCPHPNPGILVVDAANPFHPVIADEFATEFTTGANVGQSARELHVWPRQGLLAVLYFRCSAVIHACPPSADTWSIRFFDIAADPVNPPLIATYTPTFKPHEMFLWVDPHDPDRVLLWLSTPALSVDPARPNLLITDISRAREGVFTEVAAGNWNQLYPGADDPANYDFDLAVHSASVSVDGGRTYLAYLRGQFLMVDTSAVAAGDLPPGELLSLNDKLLTPIENRPRWGDSDAGCLGVCAEAHSAVPLPGRPFALVTDEVYGTFTAPSFGCPWGWARIIRTGDPSQPRIMGEYRTAANRQAFCDSPANDPQTDQLTSYSAHNLTLTRKLALIAWHSAGLQTVDIASPARPRQAGWFSPTPLPTVANEDPALSRGPNKVVMWSFPVIQNGLIYVVDVRNGLYILAYTGHRAAEIATVRFLEGNSNLGDAARLDRLGP